MPDDVSKIADDINTWLEMAEWREHMDTHMNHIVSSLDKLSKADEVNRKDHDDISTSVHSIQRSLDNHLYHHQELEKQRTSSREWLKYIVPVVLTGLNMVLAYSLLG